MNSSKIKSAISRKCDKNAELNSSAKRDRNKKIADFISQKSAAIFAKRLRLAPPFGKCRTAFCPTDKKVLTAQTARSLPLTSHKGGQPRTEFSGRRDFTGARLILMGALPPYPRKGRSPLTPVPLRGFSCKPLDPGSASRFFSAEFFSAVFLSKTT